MSVPCIHNALLQLTFRNVQLSRVGLLVERVIDPTRVIPGVIFLHVQNSEIATEVVIMILILHSLARPLDAFAHVI